MNLLNLCLARKPRPSSLAQKQKISFSNGPGWVNQSCVVAVSGTFCPAQAPGSVSCRARERTFTEAQESVHREGGGDAEPVEKHRGSLCELVSRGKHV